MGKRQGVTPFKGGGSRRGADPQVTVQGTGYTLADRCNQIERFG